MDLAAIPAVRRISHLPVIVDPSHGTGKNFMVTPLARAGVAVGADGLIIEVHDQPEHALSDGAQALTLVQYEELCSEVRSIHEVISPTPVG
jgi:3-deoxy-7-phosphoheptulonate synthase